MSSCLIYTDSFHVWCMRFSRPLPPGPPKFLGTRKKHTRWFREHPVLSDFWNYFPITDVQPRDSIVSNEETTQSFPGYSCLSVAMSHRTKDPAMDLSKVIPVRIYGDGAEAQRYLEKIILDRFGWQSLVAIGHIDFVFFQPLRKAKVRDDHHSVSLLSKFSYTTKSNLVA